MRKGACSKKYGSQDEDELIDFLKKILTKWNNNELFI